MKLSLILLVLFLSAALGFTQDSTEVFSTLKSNFDKERSAALDPLTKRYVDSLHTLKLKYTQAGDLNSALAVDAEIKGISNTGTGKSVAGNTPIPEDLAALRGIYQDSSVKAVDPFIGKYIAALEAMKLKYTQLGKLEEAVAVDKELKIQKALLEAVSPKIPAAKLDMEKLAELKWRMPEKLLPGGDSGHQWIQFAPKGRLICGWNNANFNWKQDDDGSILFYPFKNRQKAVKFQWDNVSPTATISNEESTHKVTQFRR